MATANRHLGLKLIVLALVVTIFATFDFLVQPTVTESELSKAVSNTDSSLSSQVSFDCEACFEKGSIISAKDGPEKIENIKVGDYVWATDPETGETELKVVKQLFRNKTDEWVHITVNDEEIVCTPNHPFWVPVKGWTKACHLRAGDRLQLLNGEYVVVEQVQHELLESPEATYNFEVEEYHTYYVGDSHIFVHNKCGGETSATKYGKEIHKKWDFGPGVQKKIVIGKGARVDEIDFTNKIVYELKPNNPKAISRGISQLERYLDILGEGWKGELVTYVRTF